MEYSLKRLRQSDGSWAALTENWTRQCDETGDSFEFYAGDSLPVIEKYAKEEDGGSGLQRSWAVALYDDQSRPLVAALAHWHTAPGVEGHVLKIRQVTVCPLLDFGALSEETYADVLVALTWRVYRLSQDEMEATEIRFHLRSPADFVYFAAFGKNLDGSRVFQSVKHRGAWLHIVK